MRTVSFRKIGGQEPWHIIDAQGVVLGKVAVRVASILRGKHRPDFTPNRDTGDHVVVINADKAVLTGNKLKQKVYYHHSGFIGGLKRTTAARIHKEKPADLMTRAIMGMLPKTKLGKVMARKLRVYAGKTHPHHAQQPSPLALPL